MSFPATDTGKRLLNQQTLAAALTQENELNVLAAQTAAGTNQATGLQINGALSLVEFTTVASNTGCQLPISTPGNRVYIANNGLQTLTVYTSSQDTATTPKINTTTGSSGVTQASGNNAMYVCMTAGQWYRISGT